MSGYRRSDRGPAGAQGGRARSTRPASFDGAGAGGRAEDEPRRPPPMSEPPRNARWWASALGMDRPQPADEEESSTPRLAQLCMDFFSLVLRIRTTGEVPAASLLARKLKELFDQLDTDAVEYQISPTEVEHARYGLVALIDETILHTKSPVRDDWVKQPLQIQYFAENIAGEVFFQHLDQIRKARDAAQALEVYYLCLALGFEGRYRLGSTPELAVLLEEVRREVLPQRGRRTSPSLSPHGERPDTAPAQKRRLPGFATVALAVVGVLVLLFGLAQLSDKSATDTATQLKEYGEAQGR